MNDVQMALALTTFAGLATGIGGLISYFLKDLNYRYLSIGLGFAAGVMIYIAFVNLFFQAKNELGIIYANVFFLLGIIVVTLLDRFIPHIHIDGKADSQSSRLYKAGVMTTLGIALHNLPEGLTVAFASLQDFKVGIPVAIAIAIHNIPEGFACSMPIYCGTGERKKAVLASFLAGMTEPLGALVAILVLYPFLTSYNLAALMALVAGIMIFISFDELLPVANRYGDEHSTNIGIALGIVMMILALIALEWQFT
jgi:zinc transporter, ZIP family